MHPTPPAAFSSVRLGLCAASLLLAGCCIWHRAETSQPSVEGRLTRDGKPVPGVAVTCSGRTGKSSAMTDASGAFHCDRVTTHVIVFGDTGCRVSTRFDLPEGKAVSYRSGRGTRPCADDEKIRVACDVKGTVSANVWLDESGRHPSVSCP